MRRISSKLAFGMQRRFAATQVAVSAGAFGTAATIDDVAVTTGLPKANIPAHQAVWTAIDTIGRKKLTPLASTATAEPLTAIREKVAAGPAPKAVKNAKAQFAAGKFANITALVQFYEEVMSPIRRLLITKEALQIDIYGLNDHIKLGLNLFTQSEVDEKKKQLAQKEKEMANLVKTVKDLTNDAFTTDIINDIANTLRIAGEVHEHARDLAIRVLDDMTEIQIPANEVTQALLKNLAFGDGPTDDSNLLFTYCEFPERGEVNFSNGTLDEIADSALHTISKRHQTPLTATSDQFGKQLRLGETHPLLQRSSE